MRIEGRCIYNAEVTCDAAVPRCETCDWCPDAERKRAERSFRFSLDPGAFPLERAHEDDAGLDLRSPVEVTVPARGSVTIDTGVHVELPPGTCGLLVSKSGLNVRRDITSEGLLDRGYCGSVFVKLYNNGEWNYTVYKGDKISQIVILRYESCSPVQVDSVIGGERGNNGFGSTGR